MRGMWDVGWRPTEITFPPARKGKHSQSAVCAAYPRSPTAALKPIWDAGWSKPHRPTVPAAPSLPSVLPPSAPSQSSSAAQEPRSWGENASLLSEISLERPGLFELAVRLADGSRRWSCCRRVINKHFSRAREKCRQPSGHRAAHELSGTPPGRKMQVKCFPPTLR